MVDMGSIGTTVLGYTTSGAFWVAVVIVVAVVFGFGGLAMNKRRKLKYNVIEIVAFGNGKIGTNRMKGGIFKQRTALFGLIDYGRENIFKTSDGRVIQQARTNQLHDIFGKKGFIVMRKPEDPKILVPIPKVYLQGISALFEIAPADYRDASVRIIGEATKETQGWMDKYLPYIMLGGIVVFFIIAMILSIQLINRAVDKSMEIQRQACMNAGNTAPGTSP